MIAGVGAKFEALIGAHSSNPNIPICVAVSGGSDSIALMYLLADWAQRPVHVLSVDHRLRPEAADEAAQVAVAAKALGLRHETLIWDQPRGGQAAARDARHRLLAAASRAAGARVLMLGHTRDDLCETVMIRKRHKAPRDRLAGPAVVAPSPVWPQGRGLTLIRPLLDCRRSDLREWLGARGVSWVNDPSNEAAKYERVRVRQFLARHLKLAAIVDDVAERLLAQRLVVDRALGAALLDPQLVSVSDEGLVEVVATELAPELLARMLAVLVRISGGHDRPPRAEAVAALMDDLNHAGERRTLAGAWLQTTKTGYLIGRDPGEAAGVDAGGLWDGRYAPEGGGGLAENMSVLMRASRPPDENWTPIIAERIVHEARTYQG